MSLALASKGQRPKTKDQKPKTKDQKPKTKVQKLCPIKSLFTKNPHDRNVGNSTSCSGRAVFRTTKLTTTLSR